MRPKSLARCRFQAARVGQRAAALVLVLDTAADTRPGWRCAVAAREHLQLGLLVGRDHVLIDFKPPPLPGPAVEVEHSARLGLEVGVAREEPAALTPVAAEQARRGLPPGHNDLSGIPRPRIAAIRTLGDSPPLPFA